ncbi:S-type pyocin domain-containing protein [Pseudomonas sp. C2B4]|uniref:S-type pyocin domain-containing protein n=1 Tax=Pseudomonas sp. C2B4 TaxID=2735270 RepID=UPI003557F624
MQPGPFGAGVSIYHQNQETVRRTIRTLEQELQVRSSQLPNSIEAELAAVRSEGPADPVVPIQSIVRERGVLHTLWQRKSAEYHSKTAIANAFYGGDPFNRHINEFMLIATKMEKWPGPNGIAMQALNQSLRAAVESRLLLQTLQSLNQRAANLEQTLSVLQAAEQARLAAEQEAQRAAAEQARIRAEAEALAHAQEQARLAALAEAERVAAEQARIAAEAAAQYFAAEQARLEAEAEVQRLAEQLRLEMQRQAEEQALREAMQSLNAGKGIRPFRVSGAAAANGPVFVVGAGTLALETATALAIRTALQSAAAAALTASAAAIGIASGVVIVAGVAALVYHALRDDKEPFALSVPLSDLTTYDADELLAIATANGEIDLPVAIGSRTVDNSTAFSVAATDGTTVPGKIPVRHATYDPVSNVYRTESPNAQSPGMTWTPIVSPGNASTTLPVTEPDVAPYTGATATALEGRIDPNPELDLYSFGGFIYVFPPESGIPPQYVVFKDRRDEPGVASGFGESVSGIWLGSASEGEGAAIPNQIADKLRGRDFSSFRAFREALWKAAVNDPELSKQFRANNIEEMKNGRAPFSRKIDRVGGQVKFELHHVNHISKGGEIYDVDNIRVVTPKQHSELHKGDK